jgi:type 1 glutamine amidotransferase
MLAPRTSSALVFSKTLLFRHASITNGIEAIRKLGAENHFHVDATEDASAFTAPNLAKYKVIIFLSTSGDILNEEQQAAFKDYIEGRGLAGVHAAVAGDLATEGNWPWYGEALCALFTNHSSVVQATVNVEDKTNPSTIGLPSQWVRRDEWYSFIASPRESAGAGVTG